MENTLKLFTDNITFEGIRNLFIYKCLSSHNNELVLKETKQLLIDVLDVVEQSGEEEEKILNALNCL